MDTVRVLRIIEYTGARDSIERQIRRSMKDGTHDYGSGIVIRVATVDFPAPLAKAEVVEP